MLDRTDLQLMICEQIMDMATGELVDLLSQLTGSDMVMYDEEKDIVIGEVEALAIDHVPSLKTWLGFMLYALGERMAIQQQASETE
jgi:hypothetical protein